MFYNNKKISSSREISEKFNSHYSKVAENLIKKMRPARDPLTHLNSIDKTFYFNPTNQFEVMDLINLLDEKKSVDIFNFPISTIKQVSDLISPALSYIINHSITTSNFPEKLKLSKVIPLFKNGAKNDIKNYRPISILPIFDKNCSQTFNEIFH